MIHSSLRVLVGDEEIHYDEDTEPMARDPYSELLRDGSPAATTTFRANEKIGWKHFFASVEVSASVTLHCPQDEDSIDEAYVAAAGKVYSVIEKNMGRGIEIMQRFAIEANADD